MGKKNKAQAAESGTLDSVVARDKSKGTALLLLIMGIELALFAVLAAGIIAAGGSAGKLQEQLDLGAKYLDDMDYDRALVAFNAALSIEPQSVDAYLGIVEVYIRTNEFEDALAYAKEGYDVTGDERLKEKIDMIESGDIFASNGWEMKMSGYDGDGRLVFWHEYTYNIKGQKASVAKYNAAGVQEQYLELAYDEEGKRLISYSYAIPGGDISKCAYEYGSRSYHETRYEGTSDVVRGYVEGETDSEGKHLRETHYDKDGNVTQIMVWEYNEDGKTVKRADYTGSNELKGYWIYIYDEEGRTLQQQHYNSHDELTSYTEYVYDEEGNNKGQRRYNADGVLQSETKRQ